MANIVLRNRDGKEINYPGVNYIKVNKADGETQGYAAYDPETLAPENLVSGVKVGDVEGALEVPQAVETTIDPDFSAGDMEVVPEDGKVFSKVSIPKPADLIPANIAKDVDIAGVVGTLESGGGAEQYVEYTLDESGKIVEATLYGFTAVPPYLFSGTAIERIDFTNCPGLTEIGDGAFNNCGALTSIVIPDGVTRIGEHAFSNCYALKSVVFPDSLTVIGIYAFYNDKLLTNVVIPDGVTSIGNYAFNYTSSSTASVTIGAGVTSIGQYAFYNTSLRSAEFKVTNGWWVATTETATSGTAVTIASARGAAALLRDTHRSKYWRRS